LNIKQIIVGGEFSVKINQLHVKFIQANSIFRMASEKLAAKLASLSVEQIEKISKSDDPKLKKLRDMILESRTKENVLSQTVETSEPNKIFGFQFVPMSRDYQAKLLMTANIAFLFRAVNEYLVPDDIPVVTVEEYLRDPSACDPPDTEGKYEIAKEILDDYAENKKNMEKRVIIYEFLQHTFNFNPDRHTHSVYSPNVKDPERKLIVTAASERAVISEFKAAVKDRSLKKDQREEAEARMKLIKEAREAAKKAKPEEKVCVREVERTIKGKDGKDIIVKRKIRCTQAEFDAYNAIPASQHKSGNELAVVESEKRVIPTELDPLFYFKMQEKAVKHAEGIVRDIIPPSDVYFKFMNYFNNHYEQLIAATRDIYREKPDLDWAIFPHGEFANDEKFQEYRLENARKLKSEIYSVRAYKWSILGPYKENRERLQYYGQNMGVFEEMFKNKEAEARLAKDLLRNRVKGKRAKMRAKHGVPDPAYKKEVANLGNLAELGLTDFGDDAEDSPDEDAIEVVVTEIGKGGKEVKQTKFFTEAEAPEQTAPGAV